MMNQVGGFANAIDGWIDLWGLLFGVPRQDGEGNAPYAKRVSETVLAWVGTLPAVQVWVNLFAPGGTVTENASGLGYAIALPAMTIAQVINFIVSLNSIRPVGVPFVITVAGGSGLLLGTEAFLGAVAFEGAYLINNGSTVSNGLGATTPSAQPLIPTLFLTDPSLNAGILSP